MENTTTDAEVSIKKTTSAVKGVIKFSYWISSPQENVEALRVTEELPEPIRSSAVRFGNCDHGWWEFETPRKIVFEIEHPPLEPIETSFYAESETLSPEDCVSTVRTRANSGSADSSSLELCCESDRATNTTELRRLDTDGGAHTPENTLVQHSEEQSSETKHSTPESNRERPAVGVLSTEATDAVTETIHRSTRRGFAVFVVVADEQSPLARITRQLGGTVVELPSSAGDLDEQKQSLLRAARSESYPGVIWKTASSEPIAFEASLEAFELSDRPVVEAVSESINTDVLVGIPAYNEGETIKTVVSSALNYADEVLVVDDGSTDRTADHAREAGATVVEHDRNQGYGRGLKTIFEEANYRSVDALVTVDGDGQHDTTEIPRLITKHIDSDAELVIGNRFGETATTEMPFYRRCGLWVINTLINQSLGNYRPSARIQDAQSGFRSYDATAIAWIVEHATAVDDRMSASTDILQLANRRGFTIVETPTNISYDVENPNTRNPISHGVSVVSRILTKQARRQPVTTVGLPGLAVGLAGFGIGYRLLSTIVTSGTVSPESVIVSILLVLLGTVSMFISAVQYSMNASLEEIGLR